MAGLIIIFGIFVQFALPGILLATIIILFIRKKLINKDKKLEKSIYIFIIFVCAFASCVFLLWKFEKPNELYIKMQEFNNNQSLVGLSKEEVIELLGEPESEYNTEENKKIYYYDAGNMRKEWYFGKCYTTDYYEINIYFDTDEKVEHTSITIIP